MRGMWTQAGPLAGRARMLETGRGVAWRDGVCACMFLRGLPRPYAATGVKMGIYGWCGQWTVVFCVCFVGLYRGLALLAISSFPI